MNAKKVAAAVYAVLFISLPVLLYSFYDLERLIQSGSSQFVVTLKFAVMFGLATIICLNGARIEAKLILIGTVAMVAWTWAIIYLIVPGMSMIEKI